MRDFRWLILPDARTYVDYKQVQRLAALWHELGERAFDAMFP